LFLANRYEAHEASTTTAMVAVELTDKWSLVVRHEYDWRAGESYDSSVILQRDMHAWMAELTFEADEGDSARSASLTFYPKGARAPTRPTSFVRDAAEARDEEL
jgi:hypothetical protein